MNGVIIIIIIIQHTLSGRHHAEVPLRPVHVVLLKGIRQKVGMHGVNYFAKLPARAAVYRQMVPKYQGRAS